MTDDTRKGQEAPKPGGEPGDAIPSTSAPGAPRGAALSEGVASGPGHAGDAPGAGTGGDPSADRAPGSGRDVMPDAPDRAPTQSTGSGSDRGGRAAPPSGTGTEPRGADTPREEGPRDHAGGRDAIDRAADEEVQEGRGVDDPEGAAFPNPGGGAVVAPADEDERDPATQHPDEGQGAGDELRGGGSGPVPPGTGRPLPDPDDPKGRARVAADPQSRVTPEEAAFGRDAAALAGMTRRERSPIPEDGPTAREAEPGGVSLAPDAEAMRALGVEAGRNGWVLWVLGGAAIVAGVIALAMPLVASLAANTVIAAMLLASGAVGLVTAFRRRDGGAIAVAFALSALAVITGVVMLLAPLAGITALSLLIVAYFLASGAARIWYGVKHEGMHGRGWLIAAGALSIALALLLWLGFPTSALWLPGVLLAVDLILYGALMISLAVFGKPKLDAERMA